ncbi:YraN family protein [Candidatus Gottesmanbacteria bacterium]|nr:YraN family protein [Candidatus Gottesmanbacteria bacterium]
MIPKKNNLQTGFFGESVAENYLKKHGYKILERNFKKRYTEIDIVCLDKDTLVFVEVKTRKTNSFGPPQESITHWKMQSLKRSAHYYKLLHPELPSSLRIDVLSLRLTDENKVENIELIKNITL